MKKMRVAIVGFGNLGKQLSEIVSHNQNYELVGIFSRRKISGCLPYKTLFDYKGKIDLVFVCVGSQNDLEKIAVEIIPHFNTIDCYDNHNRMKKYVFNMNKLALQNKKIALCALGWDPGLFSLVRSLISLLGYQPYTFWGRGLSQGHTQAVKNLPNVIDAVQFTLPNDLIKRKIISGECISNNKSLHKRLCYVVCDEEYQSEIKRQIINMPDYFEGYKTSVKFVSQDELNVLKTFEHKGEVLTADNTIKFNLNLKSNPAFTATVMLGFSNAIHTLISKQNYGAKIIMDLPISVLLEDKYKYL